MNALNRDSNQAFVIKGLSILRGNSRSEGYDYYKLKDLSQTRTIRVTLREKDETRDVELPEDMLERMAHYLATKNVNHGEGKFDCASFAHAANGVPYEFTQYNPSKWNQSRFDETKIKAGDTVAIVDSQAPYARQYTHFAIYLGDGLYISKFGPSGPLIVSDVEAMKKGFHGDTVYSLEPKR